MLQFICVASCDFRLSVFCCHIVAFISPFQLEIVDWAFMEADSYDALVDHIRIADPNMLIYSLITLVR